MEYLSDIQRLVLIIFVTVLLVGVIADIRNKRKAPEHSPLWLPALIALTILTLDLNFYIVAYRLQIFFASTFILGLLIAYCAERYLAVSSGKEVVASGPYALVRHPMWTGLAMAYLSFLILFFNPITIVLTAAYLAVLIFTAVSEERFLHDTLPGYPEYAKRTGRFLPKLRRHKSSRR